MANNFGKQRGLAEVEHYVTSRQKEYAKRKESLETKEVVKEVIEEIIAKEVAKMPSSNQTVISQKGVTGGGFIHPQTISLQKIQDKQTEKILQELVEMAIENGVTKAVRASLKTNNAYLIDKLHDLLIDKFYEILKKQKKLK